nr:hypothetical protein [Tanacetum cinerariifolium]
MRIKQYFLMTDYSFWEVVLNGDSLIPIRIIDGVLVAPTIVEQRLDRKNKLKAREAIEKSFGGNTKTKKVQTTLLKQQYKNFTGFNSKSLDWIHDRLQKLIRQLEILGVSLSQEDINLKSPKDIKRNGAAEPQKRNVLVETSTSNALVSQCLGYNSQVSTYAMFDCNDYLSSRSDERLPPSPIYDRPDLVFDKVPNDVETDHPVFNVKLSPTKPDQDLSPIHRPSAPIIEDWVSDSEDEFETKTPQNVSSFVQSTEQVKSPRTSVQHVETSISAVTTWTEIPKPKI